MMYYSRNGRATIADLNGENPTEYPTAGVAQLMKLNNSNSHMAVGNGKGELSLVNLTTRPTEELNTGGGSVLNFSTSLAFSEDDTLVAIGSTQDYTRVYSTETGELVKYLRDEDTNNAVSLKFSRDELIVMSAFDNQVMFFRTDDWSMSNIVQLRKINCAALVQDDNCIVGVSHFAVSFWDTENDDCASKNNEPVFEIEFEGIRLIPCLAVSDENNLIAYATGDGIISVRSMDDADVDLYTIDSAGAGIKELVFHKHELYVVRGSIMGGVGDMNVQLRSGEIVTASEDAVIVYENGECVRVLELGKGIRSLGFSNERVVLM
jgi:WD40 repeat protein